MRARILATAFACTCVHIAHGASPPPAEAYGRLPAIGSAALSPDGKRVAVEVGYEYRAAEPDRELTSLSVIEIDTGKVEQTLTPPPKNTLRGSAGPMRSGLTTTSAAPCLRAISCPHPCRS